MDKNKGLSEQQRAEKAKIEREMLENKVRFETALPKFKDEYNHLIRKYGIVHGAFIQQTPNSIQAVVAEIDCWKAVKDEEERRQKTPNFPNGKSPVVDTE